MRALLAGSCPGLPAPTWRAIVERAEGMPLYAVETVRMLVADGAWCATDGALPRRRGDARPRSRCPTRSTRSIAARLDALDAADRALLQDAAVLGQSFTLAALAAVTGTTRADARSAPRRDSCGASSCRRGAIPGRRSVASTSFVQALIREVAYATLAKRDRRARHLAAARYFESLEDDELAGVLATHYLAAYGAPRAAPRPRRWRPRRGSPCAPRPSARPASHHRQALGLPA